MTTATTYTRAFSTLGCVGFTPDQIRDLGHRHGIDSVELRGIDGSINVPERLAARYGTPANAAAEFAALGLRICALDTSLRLIDANADTRKEFLQFIPWAEAMGVNRLRVFDGGRDTHPDDNELLDAVATLRWWRELRAAKGWHVDIMVETHSSIRTTPAILRFLQVAPPGTALLWDTHHTWRLGGEFPSNTWKAIRDHVVHIHVKDSVSTPGPKRRYSHALCGAGEYPMAELLSVLTEDGYSGPVSLEWENQWHREMPPLEDALNAAARNNWW